MVAREYPAKSVSIIIPVYNGGETILSCLELVLNQDYPENLIEIIVVDDGSTDNTVEIVKSFKHRPIKLIRNESNMGRAYTRLRGAQESSHENLLLVDSRVMLDLNALQTIMKYNETIQIPSIIKGNNNNWDYTLNMLRHLAFRKFYEKEIITHIDEKNFDNVPKGTTALFIPKPVFVTATLKINYKSKYVSEDTRLLLNIVKNGYKIFLNPEYKITYLQREGFMNNFKHLYDRGPRFVDYYHGHHKTYTRIINLSLIFLVVFIVCLMVTPELVLTMGVILTMFLLCFIGVKLKKEGNNKLHILTVYLPVILTAFGLGVIKGLLLKISGKLKFNNES